MRGSSHPEISALYVLVGRQWLTTWRQWESNPPQKHCKCFSPKPWYMCPRLPTLVLNTWQVPPNFKEMLLYFTPPKSLRLATFRQLFTLRTYSQMRADTQTRTEISGLEDPSTNHCAIPAYLITCFSTEAWLDLIWWGRPFGIRWLMISIAM